jgi:hypothetical protein
MGAYRIGPVYLPEPCKAIALHHDGTPVLLPSGERLCCTRTYGHFPWIPHADQDDDGKLVEWR